MKRLILLLLVITAITAGCKKYPDGPLISLRSAKVRFLARDHTLSKYTVNGVDSLSRYKDSLCTNFHFYLNTDDGKNYCSMSGSRKDGYESILYWTWELANNNKIFKVNSTGGIDSGMGTGPFKYNVLPEWQILKLKEKDIIMQTNYNGKEYQIELTN